MTANGRSTILQTFLLILSFTLGFISSMIGSKDFLKHDCNCQCQYFETHPALTRFGARFGSGETGNKDQPLKINTAENKSKDLDSPKKYFLDCGANMASSVTLFRDTYPGAYDFIIHSFEIDPQLKPYFAPFTSDGKTFAHIPEGVSSKRGNMTAYLEGPWFPGKTNNNKDMQWGGGTFFAYQNEKKNDDGNGGLRKFSRQVEIGTVDLSQWIRDNTRKQDYVILKLDVEGAEYEILMKMLADDTFDWIDKFYGEFHDWAPTKYTQYQKDKLRDDLNSRGAHQITWAGETKSFADFDLMLNIRIPDDTPGSVFKVSETCTAVNNTTKVAIVIEVGMNAKRAKRLISTIEAYAKKTPLILFLYGDFVEQNFNLVRSWSENHEIGIRAGSRWPKQYWELQNNNMLQMDVVSAQVRLAEIGVTAAYIFPSGINPDVSRVTQKRQLRIIDSTFTFPPRKDGILTSHSYFKFRDVERTPKALELIHESLALKGGILSLDSDFPDSYMILVFLLDYLFEVSPHTIVTLRDCLA
ncbi:uncharacterized protein LOC144444380 [Glandiceps talaboti]